MISDSCDFSLAVARMLALLLDLELGPLKDALLEFWVRGVEAKGWMLERVGGTVGASCW